MMKPLGTSFESFHFLRRQFGAPSRYDKMSNIDYLWLSNVCVFSSTQFYKAAPMPNSDPVSCSSTWLERLSPILMSEMRDAGKEIGV